MDVTTLHLPKLSETANLSGLHLAGLQLPTVGLHVPGRQAVTHEGAAFATTGSGLFLPSR